MSHIDKLEAEVAKLGEEEREALYQSAHEILDECCRLLNDARGKNQKASGLAE